MEVTTLARKRKQQLLKEIEDIKIAIKELESNSLINKGSEEELMNTETLMDALMITENINRIKYSNVELVNLEEEMFEYQADATTGPVKYHLQFKLKFSQEDMETSRPFISDLKIKCDDKFIQNELKPWQNQCIRDNSLQTFQRTVVSYGQLFTKREEIIVYLKENASEGFIVEKCVEEGKYIISGINRNTDTQYFLCTWTLTWNTATLSIMNSFNLHVSNTGPFTARNNALFAELTSSSSKLTPDRVEHIWKTLAKNVMEAIEGSTSSSLE